MHGEVVDAGANGRSGVDDADESVLQGGGDALLRIPHPASQWGLQECEDADAADVAGGVYAGGSGCELGRDCAICAGKGVATVKAASGVVLALVWAYAFAFAFAAACGTGRHTPVTGGDGCEDADAGCVDGYAGYAGYSYHVVHDGRSEVRTWHDSSAAVFAYDGRDSHVWRGGGR